MKVLFALAFAASLFAQTPPCYVVDPSSFNIGAATFTGTVKVTNAPGSACGNYNVTTQVPWLHISSGVSGTPGDSGVTFTADQNPNATARAGVLSIALQAVTVTQAGATCNFSMTPTSRNFPVSGGNDTFKVQADCGWQAVSNANWLTLTTDNKISPVSYSVAANTCAAGRSGTITLLQTNLTSPPTLAVTQDGSPANISLSDYSATVAAPASNGRITVTTGDVCHWSAFADVTWIQITFGTSGTGNGGISYRVLENTGQAPRPGSIHVGALTYTITQLAPAAPPVVLKSVTNAANYNADAVSPGEIVSLFGDNMGPASIAITKAEDISNGTFPNSLAGTQVLFDGVAAPLLFTLKGQVSAVVPYGVAGKASTQVQVSYQNTVSNSMTVPVQAATPAIFSSDASGVGPGAILNQDLSVNTTGNRAERLSVIALYCTGGGVTAPPTKDGEVVGLPLRYLSLTPVVTIGGVNAAVKFAGAAPDAVAGLTQINVEVPAAVAPGIALPVIVKIGDFAGTGSVTVAVK